MVCARAASGHTGRTEGAPKGGKKRDRKEGGKEGKKEERKEGAELVSDRGEERRRGGGLFCRGGRGGSGGVSYK